MTQEYVRAVNEQGLGYGDLKTAARASLEYAFLPGDSLWQPHKLGVAARPCLPNPAAETCRMLLAKSEKARMQAGLEAQFDSFEREALAALEPAATGSQTAPS